MLHMRIHSIFPAGKLVNVISDRVGIGLCYDPVYGAVTEDPDVALSHVYHKERSG